MLFVCAALILVAASHNFASPPNDCSDVAPSQRQDCGYGGITKQECVTAHQGSCCWGEGHHGGGCSAKVPCCYWNKGAGPPPPPPPPPPKHTIHTVHIVQSCHLDVGFADTCAGILNRSVAPYFVTRGKVNTGTREARHFWKFCAIKP